MQVIVRDQSSSLLWWNLRTKIPHAEAVPQLLAIEATIYDVFPSTVPTQDLMLHGPNDWYCAARGDRIPTSTEALPSDTDQLDIVEMFDWLAWPKMLGYRLSNRSDGFLVFSSVAAKIYYTPAIMMYSLRLDSNCYLDDFLEMFLPDTDTQVLAEFSAFRNDEYGADEKYHAREIWQARMFREGFAPSQKQVICDFLTWFVPWVQFRQLKHPPPVEKIEATRLALDRLIEWWQSPTQS